MNSISEKVAVSSDTIKSSSHFRISSIDYWKYVLDKACCIRPEPVIICRSYIRWIRWILGAVRYPKNSLSLVSEVMCGFNYSFNSCGTYFPPFWIFLISYRRLKIICCITPNCFARVFCGCIKFSANSCSKWSLSHFREPSDRRLSIRLKSPLWNHLNQNACTSYNTIYFRWEKKKSIHILWQHFLFVEIHTESDMHLIYCHFSR